MGIRWAIGAAALALVSCGDGARDLSSADSNVSEIKVTPADYEVRATYAAHWVTPDTLVWMGDDLPEEAFLLDRVTSTQIDNIVRTDMPSVVADRFPHLAGGQAYRVDIEPGELKALLRGAPMLISADDPGYGPVAHLQIPGVLDALYTSGPEDADEVADYGATLSDAGTQFRVWAPTARAVRLALYDDEFGEISRMPMAFDESTGAWGLLVPEDLSGRYYRYEVTVWHPEAGEVVTHEVTDPYSLSLSTDSLYSQVIDLNDAATKPEGWDAHGVPTVDRPEQLIIYEAHIGDFSGSDETVPGPMRGKYAAFLEEETDGVAHLMRLADAGINVFHLLPAYDLGSIPEFPADHLTLDDTLAKACRLVDNLENCENAPDPDITLRALLESFDPMGPDAQALMEAIDEVDRYNWGYDPYHYTVPEGSYAMDADGAPRIREFRAMVQRLHELGFRVVMDVVYNHTFKAGLDDKSVLDKIVPGYYHRLNPVTGTIEQSTCCENTATEHVMMGKLMTDSLVVWARDYKIDGFRFDLMGHQPRDLMLEAREAVRAVDPDTYFYGEGWNFGEVANNARFRQATQLELPGTQIGTFTDRLRDAVRGGSSFVDGDALRKGQGLGNGLPLYLNELYTEEDADFVHETYQLHLDQTRVGLAGNLASFTITRPDGASVNGASVDYGGLPSGYALDPADTINYVSKHDNQTLWDNNQYRIPFDASPETRARMQLLGLSYPLYAQGIPFLHMGGEFLRSKSFLRDSYNYGHWFNAVDFSRQTNNYAVGLPPAVKDEANWPLITRLLEKNDGRDRVSPELIRRTSDAFLDMVRVRASSPLFSLATAEDIEARVSFLNEGPDQVDGLIVMSIRDDGALSDLDPAVRELIVVFNHGPEVTRVSLPDANGLQLHPALAASASGMFADIALSEQGAQMPAFTTAVFVRGQ